MNLLILRLRFRLATKYLPRWRWRIATVVDRLPGQCWSRLAEWAGDWHGYDREDRRGLPWARQDRMCRQDAARVGSCYCGKLQPEAEAEVAR